METLQNTFSCSKACSRLSSPQVSQLSRAELSDRSLHGLCLKKVCIHNIAPFCKGQEMCNITPAQGLKSLQATVTFASSTLGKKPPTIKTTVQDRKKSYAEMLHMGFLKEQSWHFLTAKQWRWHGCLHHASQTCRLHFSLEWPECLQKYTPPQGCFSASAH